MGCTQKSLSRRKFISTAALAVGTVALFTTADTFTGGTVKAGDFDSTVSDLKNNLSDIRNSYIPKSEKASSNGVATLGKDGKVPLTQLPTAISIAGIQVVEKKSDLAGLSSSITDGSVVVVLEEDQTYSYVSSNWTPVNIGGEGAVQVGNGNPTTAPGTSDPKVYVNLQDGGIFAWDSNLNSWISATYTPAYKSPVTPTGNLTSTNAQDALEELQSDVDTINAKQGATTGTGAPTKLPDITKGEPTYYIDNSNGDLYTYNTTTGTWEKVSDAKNIAYDNTTSKLEANNVQDAITELANDLNSTSGQGLPTHTPNPTNNEPTIYVDEKTGNIYSYNTTTGTWTSVSQNLASTTGTTIPTTTPNYTAGEPGYYVDQTTGKFYTYNTTTNTWEDSTHASNVEVTPTGNLVSTNTQNALVELQTDIDTLNTGLTTTNSNVTDILSTLGTVDNQTNLGTFTGTTITDNATVKSALQQVETKLETTGAGLTAMSGNGAPTAAPNYANGETGIYTDKTTGDIYTYNTTTNTWEKANDAINTAYTNTTSGLTATNVQGAIDEVDSNVDDIRTALGLADNQTNYGTTFTGTTIPDNSTLVQALQALETSQENTKNSTSNFTTGSVLFANTDGTITQDNANLFWDNTNNKLGIGTTTPNQSLEIGSNGAISFSGTSPWLNASDKKLYSSADGALDWLTHNAALEHGFGVRDEVSRKVFLNTSGDSYINGGNLGVGTNTPIEKLDVSGSVKIDQVLRLKPTTPPTIPLAGDIYFDSLSNTHKAYDGTNWYDMY